MLKLNAKIWIALAGVVVVGSLIWESVFLKSEKPATPLLNFSLNTLSAFEIESFLNGLRFEKDENGAWWVQEYKTDLSKSLEPAATTKTPRTKTNIKTVTDFLNTLASIKLDEPVSLKTPPEKFHINPKSLQIVFYNQKQKLDRIFIGKHGEDGFSNYLKIENKPGIYWMPHDIRSLALRPQADWAAPLETNENS